jgi:hypothetical protein
MDPPPSTFSIVRSCHNHMSSLRIGLCCRFVLDCGVSDKCVCCLGERVRDRKFRSMFEFGSQRRNVSTKQVPDSYEYRSILES